MLGNMISRKQCYLRFLIVSYLKLCLEEGIVLKGCYVISQRNYDRTICRQLDFQSSNFTFQEANPFSHLLNLDTFLSTFILKILTHSSKLMHLIFKQNFTDRGSLKIKVECCSFSLPYTVKRTEFSTCIVNRKWHIRTSDLVLSHAKFS
ncbi:unnamed protein product, partial [Vitis vinifera]